MTTLHTSRPFAASPSEVFAAISNGDRLARWWGPQGFTNCFHQFEFQAGGQWVFDMIAPDGKSYANTSVFAAITPDHQVVIDHGCVPHFRLTITLEATNGGTLLSWDQTFADPAVAEAFRSIAAPANEQNLDRLGVELGLAS
ncbi:SRPBCC domain-containing protein [Burkholderiaceae bacterium DAT-1]|nr:SRPBCC domain-containing protein [Burkholderiaceae bacterium DAT-1]